MNLSLASRARVRGILRAASLNGEWTWEAKDIRSRAPNQCGDRSIPTLVTPTDFGQNVFSRVPTQSASGILARFSGAARTHGPGGI